MIKYGLKLLLCSVLLLNTAIAKTVDEPTGLWKAHNDEGAPTGFIRVTQKAGVYTGVIENGLPDVTEEQFCTACKGARKGQPLIGMTIIKNVKANGDEYKGDEILDPFSGNTYRVKLKMIESGQKMEVRGFIGFSLFGRTQIWERVNNGK